jgi:oligopeptide/dipeptide ABC transporter ATP-binding protein
MREKLIKVKNLKKYFVSGMFNKGTIKAVDGVSFEVEKGETFALVGESGCGKSTVGRCLLRLLKPTSGEIFFNGMGLEKMKGNPRVLRRKMQMIFQDADGSLNPRMRVIDLLLEPLKVHGLINGTKEEEVLKLLELANLSPDMIGRYPHELSGGQRQRIGIARAMSLIPEFVVADEPAASLDPSVQAQMLDLMKRFQKKYDIGYLFISHNLNVVRLMADRIAVMYMGKFIEVGKPKSIFDHAKHPYTRALLSAVLSPYPWTKQKRIVLKGELPSPFNPPLGCRFQSRCSEAKYSCAYNEPVLREIENEHLVACNFV